MLNAAPSHAGGSPEWTCLSESTTPHASTIVEWDRAVRTLEESLPDGYWRKSVYHVWERQVAHQLLEGVAPELAPRAAFMQVNQVSHSLYGVCVSLRQTAGGVEKVPASAPLSPSPFRWLVAVVSLEQITPPGVWREDMVRVWYSLVAQGLAAGISIDDAQRAAFKQVNETTGELCGVRLSLPSAT